MLVEYLQFRLYYIVSYIASTSWRSMIYIWVFAFYLTCVKEIKDKPPQKITIVENMESSRSP